MERKSFLDQEAPPGYVAGLGRGASGFTTSADLGSARIRPGVVIDRADDDDDDDDDRYGDVDDDESGLLSSRKLDEDDEEADRIFESIENRLRSRNKKRKYDDESNDKLQPFEEVEETISTEFASYKRELAVITTEQWENLPEVGDLTRKNKRTRLLEQQQRRFYTAPDTLLASNINKGNTDTAIDVDEEATDFQSLSSARDMMLGQKLDNLLGNEDQEEEKQRQRLLLEQLDKETVSDSQVNDVKRARLIFSSLRKSDPMNPTSWISSARLEEQDKKFDLAKKYIQEGCQIIKRNEDVWLENIRLNFTNLRLCKVLITEALTHNAKSVKLWLKAVELEADMISKKRVLRKGLEILSNSVELWKHLIYLEDDSVDVKKFLYKAIEMCPNDIELWLTLVNLEDISEGKKLLNKARKQLPSSHEIWVMAGRLEEQSDATETKIAKVIEKGIKEVDNHTPDESKLSRDEWLSEAIRMEQEGYLKTSRAIIKNVMNRGLDGVQDDDKLSIWFQTADSATIEGNFETVNCIYEHIIESYPNSIETWDKLFDAIKQQEGKQEMLFDYYEKSVELNPNFTILWLKYAKDKLQNEKNNDDARAILKRAIEFLPDDEEIWLAAIKVEVLDKKYAKAESLSDESREIVESPRVWYKHVHLKRQLEKTGEALDLVDEALDRFPSCDKLYMEKGQILEDMKKDLEARQVYSMGTKTCPNSLPLWLLLARIDANKLNLVVRARSVLDMALISNPLSDLLYVERIRLEIREKNIPQAVNIVNRALQQIPNSALLWNEKLRLIEKSSIRKNASVDALKKTNQSPIILNAFGYFFWIDGKIPKAKTWLLKAIDLDEDNGDLWAWAYSFITKHDNPEETQRLVKRFIQAEPGHGEKWAQVIKDPKNFEKDKIELLKQTAEQLTR